MIVNAAKIFSTMGNPDSLVPLALKDFSNSLGMTAGSYASGKKEEGIDRAIDEFGTAFIWLGGIPAYKFLFDKTVFNAYKLDSKIDPRNLKDMEVYEKIKKYAPNEEIRKNLEKAEKNKRLFKNLAATKFFASTILAAASYFTLTRMKQNYTEKRIKKSLIEEHNKKQNENKDINQNNSKPSFKGVGRIVEEFAFSPVKNMYLLDGFITGERLIDSRNPQEFCGYAIKEAFCLSFLYYFGRKIQGSMEKYSDRKHNKSITLDARVLENKYIKQAFEDKSIEKSIKAFDEVKGSKTALYEFLHKSPDNQIVQIAKQSDLIVSLKGTNKIDTRKYIDLKEIEGVRDKVSKLYEQYNKALENGESSDAFFKKVKKLKRESIIVGIVSCITVLGIVTPAIMYIKRLMDKSGKEFQTKTDIKEQLIRDGIIL